MALAAIEVWWYWLFSWQANYLSRKKW